MSTCDGIAKSHKKCKGIVKAAPPRPRTFRLTGGKIVVEPKKTGGVEAMLEMLREAARMLEGELGAREQDAA